MSPPPPFLADEVVEEFLLLLPPEDPAWLVRCSAVCKPWRRILAAPRFRCRYREFHGTPPVLGLFQKDGRFVPTSGLLPDQPDRTGWTAVDCRHGRALFDACSQEYRYAYDLVVLDPMTRHRSRVPWPVVRSMFFSAAVLCVAQGCDHHGCQGGGPFRLVFVTTNLQHRLTVGWLYSSETRLWTMLTSVYHPNFIKYNHNSGAPSVLVGDSLYFNVNGIVECQLGALRLSMLEKPIHGDGALMAAEDGGLGFAAVVDATNLTMWSVGTGNEGAREWAKLRVIDLKTLLPDGALLKPTLKFAINGSRASFVSAFAEGTQVIFVSTYAGSYMVDLKSGRARKVSCEYGEKIFPYTRLYIPAMEAACVGQGQ